MSKKSENIEKKKSAQKSGKKRGRKQLSKAQSLARIGYLKGLLQKGMMLDEVKKDFFEEFGLKSVEVFNRLYSRARAEFLEEFYQTEQLKKKDLEQDKKWQQTKKNLIKSKELIYNSISYIIMRNQKKIRVEQGGKMVEKTVLDLNLGDARNLKTLWEMNLVGLGEPTTGRPVGLPKGGGKDDPVVDTPYVPEEEIIRKKTIWDDFDVNEMNYEEVEMFEKVVYRTMNGRVTGNDKKEESSTELPRLRTTSK